MKMQIVRKILPDDPPTHLSLEPESSADADLLDELIMTGVTIGHGRDAVTWRPIHAQILLSVRADAK